MSSIRITSLVLMLLGSTVSIAQTSEKEIDDLIFEHPNPNFWPLMSTSQSAISALGSFALRPSNDGRRIFVLETKNGVVCEAKNSIARSWLTSVYSQRDRSARFPAALIQEVDLTRLDPSETSFPKSCYVFRAGQSSIAFAFASGDARQMAIFFPEYSTSHPQTITIHREAGATTIQTLALKLGEQRSVGGRILAASGGTLLRKDASGRYVVELLSKGRQAKSIALVKWEEASERVSRFSQRKASLLGLTSADTFTSKVDYESFLVRATVGGGPGRLPIFDFAQHRGEGQ